MNKKIRKPKDLVKILGRLRSKKKKAVFTNGCFDILHVGHVRYLHNAKALGDVLVIGVNSDRSVRMIKGKGRPINNQADRAEILASLYFVDYITFFDDATPENLIRMLRPDLLVKGGDWRVKDIAGGAFVKSCGGRVVTVPFVKGYSTTSLLKGIGRRKRT